MEDEYWKRFKTTGSVADYLSYRGAADRNNEEQQKTQGDGYDGKHNSDRHDTVGTAHGGI